MKAPNRPKRSLLSILLLLALAFLFLFAPAGWAAQFERLASSALPNLEAQATVYQQGNIEYAYVTLDGAQLFPVTANVPGGKPTPGLSPVQIRIQAIEPPLHRILATDFDPENLYVTVASLDRQTVILAGDQLRGTQEIILTVTQLDAQLAEKPISTLAQDWAEIIHRALLQAQAVRRPQARQQQMLQAIAIACSIGIFSLGLYAIHRWIYALFKRRKHWLMESTAAEASPDWATSAADPTENFKQTQRLRQQQMLNVLLRRLLRLTQVLVWLGGIAWILFTFPETRSIGKTLLSSIIKLFIIALVMLVAAQICRLLVNQRLKSMLEEASLKPDEMQRMLLRAPTLSGVLDEIIKLVAWCLAIVLLIDWSQVSIASIWAGAGLLSVAFTLIFQNLLRDWLNGFLIIFGDHYAVGDIIKVVDTTGLVEKMSLRSTQVRGDGGSLTTVPHGQVTTIHNLTKDWSRVDFVVTVAQGADITHAMQMMQQVAAAMAADPEWRSDILEPTSLIGVDGISAGGTKISMWIKTRRSRQWAVEQTFRYRLKLAFDQEGIAVS